jgi:dipeptidase
MKKLFLTIALAILAIATTHVSGYACTNFLITKGATVDGSTMISYSADSHVLFGELYHWPAATYPAGSMYKIYEWDTGRFLGQIPQASQTYSVVGNINEYQLAIGETTYGGRDELSMSRDGQLIDYGTLIYITLQRARTAREAIQTMTELVEKYGYYSSGESFSIADPNEVWILEMIGKGGTYKLTSANIKAISAAMPSAISKGIAKLANKTFLTQDALNAEVKKVFETAKLSDEEIKNHLKTIEKNTTVTWNNGALWVARQIPDGYISGHANHARITTFPVQKANNFNDPNQTTFHSLDVISFAREKGFFTGSDDEFSFSDIYAPIDFGGARFCEARVFSGFNKVNSEMGKYLDYAMGKDLKNRMPLWVKVDNKLTVHDVMGLMRDYYQNTPMDMTQDIGAGPYKSIVRWRPMTWSVDGENYLHERAISTQQTGFSFVTQSRNWLPNPIGGIIWFGVDDTYTTVYSPMYCGMTRVPETFAVGNGSMMEFSDNAAFWVFNQVSNLAYTRYSDMIKDIQPVQQNLEKGFIEEIKAIDKAASEMYKSNPELAIEFITDYSVTQGNSTVYTWKKLYSYLFTKYLDGNVKFSQPVPEGDAYIPPMVKFPGYNEEWYRMIVKDAGDKLKVIGAGH